jgi:hypothetical protein
VAEGVTPGAVPSTEVSATAAASTELEPVQPPASAASRTERTRSDGYRRRFGIVYFFLAVISGAAVGAFIVSVSRPRPPQAAAWSAWHPTGNATARILQISDRVPQSYRLTNGDALAVAHASSPTAVSTTNQSVSVPVSQITVLPKLSTVDTSGTLQISLCGLGTDCTIASGKASTARYELLRREALELALYTFKYVRPISSITVIMPPAANSKVKRPIAIFLPRTDVQTLLSRPLADTLSARTPGIGRMRSSEEALVNAITSPRTYAYNFESAGDGTVTEVLTPYNSAG